MVILWLLLVPWDLSEQGPAGQLRPEGRDSYFGPRIATVVVLAAFAGGVAAFWDSRAGRLFLGGSSAAVLMLFAWRAGSATSAGANLWLAGLLTVVIPGTAVAFVAAYRLAVFLRSVV